MIRLLIQRCPQLQGKNMRLGKSSIARQRRRRCCRRRGLAASSAAAALCDVVAAEAGDAGEVESTDSQRACSFPHYPPGPVSYTHLTLPTNREV